MKYKINLDEDSISIWDKKGEVVYWNREEWEENSGVVFSIVNAVKLAYEGKDLRKILKSN